MAEEPLLPLDEQPCTTGKPLPPTRISPHCTCSGRPSILERRTRSRRVVPLLARDWQLGDWLLRPARWWVPSFVEGHWLQLLLVCLIHLVDLTHRIICVFVLLVFVARVVACAWTVRLQMSSCSIELSTNRLTTQLNLCALLNLWHLIHLLHAYRSTMSTVVRAPSLHSTCFLLGCWQTADCWAVLMSTIV